MHGLSMMSPVCSMEIVFISQEWVIYFIYYYYYYGKYIISHISYSDQALLDHFQFPGEDIKENMLHE